MGMDAVLDAAARKNGGVLSFRDFTELALFAPEHGYYARKRERVGTAEGTDFYTSATMGAVFGKLLVAAAQSLLAEAGLDTRECSFIEIGAEPGQAHLREAEDIFAETKTFRLGDTVEIPEKAVVFANELLDAQPFHRLVFKDGAWREIGVIRAGNGEWVETLLPTLSTPELARFIAETLPATIDEDWHIDIALDAEALLKKILTGNWRGAMIFPDYGKRLADCLDTYPEGTARAYFRHGLSNALTARPGEQDLTCHVLWDRLEPVAEAAGFSRVSTLRQEAFFMKFALPAIQKIIDAGSDQHSEAAMRERAKLIEIIHPGKMGHAFQVLSGIRK